MFKGVSTRQAYESCLKRGLCQGHLKEFEKEESSIPDIIELPRKAFLFIRMNILSTILFKKSTKCEKIKILLQRTPVFSRILAKGDASEAVDEILVLDSVVVFTLCELSKICCTAALFQVINKDTGNPELEQRKKLLLVDRFEGSILQHLYPVLQENFIGFDIDLLRVSYVLTLLFVRNYCVKLDIRTALKTIEEDFKGDMRWEDFKKRGDSALLNENYNEALQSYSAAVMLNSYSSDLFAKKANVFLKLGKSKAAQLDAYISVIINPESKVGYILLAKAYADQNSCKEAEMIDKYGPLKSQGDDLLSPENLKELTVNFEKTDINNQSSENTIEKSDNKSFENIAEKSDNQSSGNIAENSVDDVKSSEYFPELVDSDSDDSDKEADEKNIPELVDASDSDDSENTEKKTVNTHIKNKSKKKRALPIPSEDSFDETTDMVKVRTCLKEASEALLSDCGYKAVQLFRGPLRTFMESPTLNTLEENEIVCIKYAYGIAYCKSGGYEDLLKGISILKEITEKHDSVTFPAVNYALGLAYRKLNRFKDALNHLETVNNFLSKGIHFKVYSWPEVITVIQETKPDVLKELVHELITECENPPNPDAFCRYALCGYQPTIYYSDPDFKGYTSLLCSEQCCLQYHLQCWKIMKAEKNLTDKEFLEQNCFTPDCEGIFIKVQNIDKKGDVAKEFTSDFKKSSKQKSTKWEKKTDVKEKKKKKTNVKSEDGTQETLFENGRSSSRKNSTSSDKSNIVPISGSTIPSTEEGAYVSESVQKSTQKPKLVESNAHVKSKESYSLPVNSSKEVHTVPADNKIESNSKRAEKVTSVSEQKNLKTSQLCESFAESSSKLENAIKKYASSKEKAFRLPDLPYCSNSQNFGDEDKESSLSKIFLSESIKRNVYSYMSDFLQHHGPLRFDDQLLMDEVSSFPEEANAIIAEFGGIVEFLKNDMRFACVADKYICVIADIAKAYQMNIANSSAPDLDDFPPLNNANDLKYNQSKRDTKHPNFNLNPNAMEYKPFVTSSTFSLKSDSSEFSNNGNNIQNDVLISQEEALKMDPCPNFKPLSSVALDSEAMELNGEMKNTEIASDDEKDQNFNVANKSDVHSKHNSLEKSKNMFMSSVDIPSCDKDFQINNNKMLESSKIKKVQVQLLPVLKEYCNEHYKNYHSYVNSCIKPYCLHKLPETATKETETDFSKMEITPAEQSKKIADALKAINKKLGRENVSLKEQLEETSKSKEELQGEIYSLKLTLTRTYEDLEMIKLEQNEKEEKLVSGREYLLQCLTDSHSRNDELKQRISVLEAVNSRLEENIEVLEAKVNDVEENKKKELEAEEKKYSETVKKFLTENSELKNRVKSAEINYLQIKKTEYLSRIDDKIIEAETRKNGLTESLSMFSANLNPMIDTHMKTVCAALSTYVQEMHALKTDFVKTINEQIEKVENGVSLQDLNIIELKKLPDPPAMQNLLPGADKLVPSSSQIPQMDLNLFNFGTMPQMPSAAVIPSSVSPAVGAQPSKLTASRFMPTFLSQSKLPAPVIPQISPSATAIPQTTPLAAVTPQAVPSATVRSQPVVPVAVPSATIVPQTSPCATVFPQATPSTTVIPTSSPAATVISSLSALNADLKSSLDLNSQLSDPSKNTMTSVNSFTCMPPTVPTLDPEFNKTCAIFKPVSNCKPPASKVPPGIIGSKTSSVSSRTASNSSKDSLEAFPSCSSKDALDSFPLSSSKDSLETFPSAERTLSSMNSATKVTDSGSINSLSEKKITTTKTGGSYDKLLRKLQEHFPAIKQEDLISVVKEFRSQRHGKLTGLPIDTIISECTVFIQGKENQKKLQEQRLAQLQPKPNKVLVNKKLVPDPKACPPADQQNMKKKSAWGIDPENKKTFSGNIDDDCTICCDPMSTTSAYKVGCGHAFHEECIRQWLKNKSNCPVCRVLLLLPEEYPSL